MDLMDFIKKPPVVFIKKELINELNFNPKGFEFFLNQINIEEDSKEQIRVILGESKRIPAALGGYHGAYKGGLFDHILLVTNLVYQICSNADFLKTHLNWLKKEQIEISENYDEIDSSKAIQTAIYHDFGKVPYYTFKLNIQNRKIYTKRVHRQEVSLEINEKFNYVGYDSHVDECIAVLKQYNLPFDDEIYKAIIFHHGPWAKYNPFEPTKLSQLIHAADMLSSHLYKI